MEDNVWQLEEGEVRKPGIVHVVMLALFTGIGIVVGTFGSLAIPLRDQRLCAHTLTDSLPLSVVFMFF